MYNNNTTIASAGTYSTFAGADISVVIGGSVVGSIQALSYSVTREKGPLFVMKTTPDPIAYARGKRVVAGTLIFLTLDKQALIGHFTDHDIPTSFYANKDDVRYDYGEIGDNDPFSLYQQAVSGAAVSDDPFATGNLDQAGDERLKTNAWYADQILPFDIHASATNEFGQIAKRAFIGVEIMNEGSGMSIDDLAMEEQYTFAARGVKGWTEVPKHVL